MIHLSTSNVWNDYCQLTIELLWVDLMQHCYLRATWTWQDSDVLFVIIKLYFILACYFLFHLLFFFFLFSSSFWCPIPFCNSVWCSLMSIIDLNIQHFDAFDITFYHLVKRLCYVDMNLYVLCDSLMFWSILSCG